MIFLKSTTARSSFYSYVWWNCSREKV